MATVAATAHKQPLWPLRASSDLVCARKRALKVVSTSVSTCGVGVYWEHLGLDLCMRGRVLICNLDLNLHGCMYVLTRGTLVLVSRFSH